MSLPRFYSAGLVASAALVHVLIAFPANANDTIVVSEGRFGSDPELRLIVVSMDVAIVNAQWPGQKLGVQIDTYHQFLQPVPTVVGGVGYAVVDGSGNEALLYFTDLPLIHVTTPHTIVDEPRVPAKFRMAFGSGITDEVDMGIEYRGGFSQSYPKKSYRIEFWTDSTGATTRDMQLLGMRIDDDWNLQAMYVEPLRIRSNLGHALWVDMHTPYYAFQEPDAMHSIRTRYAELFVNGSYRGLYTVGERIDRKQLQLKSYNGNIRGELFKGSEWGVTEFGTMPPPYDNLEPLWAGFELEYPREVIEWGNLHAFIEFVVGSEYNTFNEQFPERFNMSNAVDHFIFLNLLRAMDNTGKNTFLGRYTANGPYFHVPWDLDATFGLFWDGSLDPHTWLIISNGMYDRLMQDCAPNGFTDRVQTRWNQLRSGLCTVPSLMARFQSMHDQLAASGVYQREEMAWQDYTYDPGHLAYIETWLHQRTAYLDAAFSSICLGTGGEVSAAEAQDIRLYPNPATDNITLDLAPEMLPCRVVISDALGRRVQEILVNSENSFIALANLKAGAYHVRVLKDGMPPLHRALVVR